ncbi:unnamed protein product [Boreogadus saida]
MATSITLVTPVTPELTCPDGRQVTGDRRQQQQVTSSQSDRTYRRTPPFRLSGWGFVGGATELDLSCLQNGRLCTAQSGFELWARLP